MTENPSHKYYDNTTTNTTTIEVDNGDTSNHSISKFGNSSIKGSE